MKKTGLILIAGIGILIIVFWLLANKTGRSVSGFKEWTQNLEEVVDSSNEDMIIRFKYLPSELGFANYMGDKLTKKDIDSFYRSGNDSMDFIQVSIQRNYQKAEQIAKKMKLEQVIQQGFTANQVQIFLDNIVVRDCITEMTDEKGMARKILVPVYASQQKNIKEIKILHKYRPVRVTTTSIKQIIPNKKPKLSI